MSIISSIYNQGTGLITPISEGQLPIVVDDLTVNGNLTVLGTSNLIADVTCGDNLVVAQTTTTENLIINNNTILDNGVGQNSGALLKLPLNNGIDGQVLTILNDAVTPITTSWKTPVNDYVQFNTTTNKLSKVDFSGTAEISNLVLGASIGLSTAQKFILPSNTSTAALNTVLTLTNTTSKKTSWEPLPVQITDYTNYNSTNKTLISNVSSVATIITDIQLTTTGQTGQKFQLPSNTSTALNNSILSINSTTKNTTWISDYLDYNSTTTAIENNVTGSGVAITNLQLTTIGQSGEKFQLPFNTSSTTAGSGTYYLTIANNTKNSFWAVPFANMSYDGSSYVLSSETAGAGILPITNIQMTTIGRLNQKFNLPTNTSTALNGSLLSINSSSKDTLWDSNYLKYNTTSTAIENNVTGSAVAITDLQLTTIGQSSQKFQLPSNTSTALNGSLLSINSTTKNTTWQSDYLTYDTATTEIKNKVTGSAVAITSLQLTSIGKFNEKFDLPSNTSTALNNSVLSFNSTTFGTSWVVPAMIPTTTETSITIGVATATAATVEMCRASNLTAGTYLITYYIDLDISATARVFSYSSYGISSAVGSLTGAGAIVGLCVGDSVPYTAPVITGTTPVRYIGSGVCVLTATTTLYLLVRFVYTGTTFNTKGTLRVTKLA
tara:strand:- start:2478 stop:4475 length:1998 start_codon:yes stop_codon:yes gene_type:complete